MADSFHKHARRFLAAAIYCVLFFVLSSIAMIVFPGGTSLDFQRRHYSFFTNFLSDLGRTRTFANQSNLVSMTFFLAAMGCGAAALGWFFVTLTACIDRRRRALHLSRLGAVLGIGSGLCFFGVALTPWDVFFTPHMQFMLWAFRLFLGAVLVNFVAVLFTPGLPRRFAWIFAAFALLLFAYLCLLSMGPAGDTRTGLMIQATGQKVIAYSAVLTVLIQSLTMRSHLLRTHTI